MFLVARIPVRIPTLAVCRRLRGILDRPYLGRGSGARGGFAELGGKGGGGRPDMAQGGGADIAGAEAALKAATDHIAGVSA